MKPAQIFHVVARRDITDKATEARCSRAFESWNWMYESGAMRPVHCWEFQRNATSVGCERDLPFLKDALEAGIKHAESPSDAVLFTNDDVILHPLLAGELSRHLNFFPAGSARRADIDASKYKIPPLYRPPLDFLEVSTPHIGRDAFLFQVGWLKHHWTAIPDFILGSWGWDVCVAIFIRLMRGCAVKTVSDLYETIFGCELPDGLIIHERHESKWNQGNWAEDPANRHNRALFDKWALAYCPAMTMELIERHEWPPGALLRHPKYMAEMGGTVKHLCAKL